MKYECISLCMWLSAVSYYAKSHAVHFENDLNRTLKIFVKMNNYENEFAL